MGPAGNSDDLTQKQQTSNDTVETPVQSSKEVDDTIEKNEASGPEIQEKDNEQKKKEKKQKKNKDSTKNANITPAGNSDDLTQKQQTSNGTVETPVQSSQELDDTIEKN